MEGLAFVASYPKLPIRKQGNIFCVYPEGKYQNVADIKGQINERYTVSVKKWFFFNLSLTAKPQVVEFGSNVSVCRRNLKFATIYNSLSHLLRFSVSLLFKVMKLIWNFCLNFGCKKDILPLETFSVKF